VLHVSIADAIGLGLVPFLLGDVIKLVVAAVSFPAAWWVVGRRPSDR
jgi:biotin transport system substrate-specific component